MVEGATENTVVVQALIDNLLARGLDPSLPRLFIVDGAKALSKAIRNTFGVEPNHYGNCEPRYAEILKPITYERRGNYLSYGVKVVPKRQLPILRNALQEHLRKAHADSAIETIMKAA